MNNDLISREALKEKAETVTLWNGDVRRFISYETIDNAPTVEPERPQGEGKFECRIKIKDLISMLLEFDINRKADIYTNDEDNIVINITDMRGEEE